MHKKNDCDGCRDNNRRRLALLELTDPGEFNPKRPGRRYFEIGNFVTLVAASSFLLIFVMSEALSYIFSSHSRIVLFWALNKCFISSFIIYFILFPFISSPVIHLFFYYFELSLYFFPKSFIVLLFFSLSFCLLFPYSVISSFLFFHSLIPIISFLHSYSSIP